MDQLAPGAGPRLLASSEEAGTAPADRRFRPDVEGLRAVAVVLVVLYHAGVPGLTGGYVGVDVFFVISGFVITGVLLRERRGTDRTSIGDFYARRIRRVLPAATVVILLTVLASFIALGNVSGDIVADDGRWAAVFLSNFHFEAVGTNYLTATLPPSPLQNFWSLSVEEQFYVVYPALFLVLARLRGRLSLQTRLAGALGVVIVASFWLSVAQTGSHPSTAYFSPLTRAWELALGALVAVATPWLQQVPSKISAALTWAGLLAIAYSAFAFDAQTTYPGSAVAVPVIGAGLIIAGGMTAEVWGVERLLALPVFQWFGRRSYSLYLWHWPILIIAAERNGLTSLPLGESLALVGASVIASMVSYAMVENPIRHLRVPSRRTVLAGIVAIVATVVVLSLVITGQSAGVRSYEVVPVTSAAELSQQVAAAAHITHVPVGLRPAATQVGRFWGGSYTSAACQAGPEASSERVCTMGDTGAAPLMVLYGDSHAQMWIPAFNAIASAAHWRLIVLSKNYCPAELVTIRNNVNIGSPGSVDNYCDEWHTWAVQEIRALRPKLLVISQESVYQSPATPATPPAFFTGAAWDAGLASLMQAVHLPDLKTDFLGNIPILEQSGPECIAEHWTDVQACSRSTADAVVSFNAGERLTATRLGATYIDTTPWFCSDRCTAIVSNYGVYLDALHINALWAMYLENVLADALGLPTGSVRATHMTPMGS